MCQLSGELDVLVSVMGGFERPSNGPLVSGDQNLWTVLLLLGVPERAVMGIMGWSNTGMAARYQHITSSVRQDVATQVGGLLWKQDASET